MLISDNYRELNRELHKTNPHYGAFGAKWAPTIRAWCKRLGASTVLDYGAGKMELSKALFPTVRVINYDPAVDECSARPEAADLVVSCDVFEHLEPDTIEPVLDDIKSLALKGVFFVIASEPALKTLPDGRNAHLTQQKADWWRPKIEARWDVLSENVLGQDSIFIGVRK